MSKVPESFGGINAEYKHLVCGHEDVLTAEEVKDYNKSPDKFALDDRALGPDGKPAQVLHCRGTCNALRPLGEFEFLANKENLDPNFETEEVEEEVEEEVDGRRVRKVVKVKKKKGKK